jgi:hypothetical protein
MDFKKGDAVVCINNKDADDVLTIGKTYKIKYVGVSSSLLYIGLTEDGYWSYRFISLKDYRNKKLEKII